MRSECKLAVVLFMLSMLFLSSGCASILSKSTYPVSITSEPSGADFTIYNKDGQEIHVGHTPATVDLEAGRIVLRLPPGLRELNRR